MLWKSHAACVLLHKWHVLSLNDMLLSWTLTAPMHTAIASSLSKEAAHVFLNSSLSDSKLSMLSSLCPIWKEWPPSKISKQMKYTSFNRATFVNWFILLLSTVNNRYFASWPVNLKLLWHWKVLCKKNCSLNDSQLTVVQSYRYRLQITERARNIQKTWKKSGKKMFCFYFRSLFFVFFIFSISTSTAWTATWF